MAGDDVITSYGWCAPSASLVRHLQPEAIAQVEWEMRPCNGEHRWERWIHRLQCGCAQCAGEKRYVECAGCDAEIREDAAGFEEAWEAATWA